MPAYTPEEAHVLALEAVNARDVDAALALFEPSAVLVEGDGTIWTGTAAIRGYFERVFAFHATFQIDIVKSITQGDIEFSSYRWNAAWTGPDGNPLTAAGQSLEILRRQPDRT